MWVSEGLRVPYFDEWIWMWHTCFTVLAEVEVGGYIAFVTNSNNWIHATVVTLHAIMHCSACGVCSGGSFVRCFRTISKSWCRVQFLANDLSDHLFHKSLLPELLFLALWLLAFHVLDEDDLT